MKILLKKSKRYWLPTKETAVEEAFIIENDILSIDDGDFACVELEVNHTVQCSWWNDEDDQFTDCTIVGFEEELLIVQSPTGIKSKATIDCIRLKVKEFKGKLFSLKEGLKVCAPNMHATIEGKHDIEQKPKDAIKEDEPKLKEVEVKVEDEPKRKIEMDKQEVQQSSNNLQQEQVKGAEAPLKIASCCFPLLGAILYFVWKDSKPEAAKDVCKFALIGFGTSFVLNILVMIVGAIAGA